MISPNNLESPPSSVFSPGSMTGNASASCNAQTAPLHPSASDYPLLPESATSEAMMQQIMDLKLQLAECLAENDTLKHKNGLLTKHNDELTREGSDLATDLDGAYGQIAKLKHERDESVRDLTRARVLQIRQDSSRRAKLLLGGSGDGDSGSNEPNNTGSSGSLDVSMTKPDPKMSEESKRTSWLSRLSVSFKTSSSNHHDRFASTSSSMVDRCSPSTAAMQSISKSTLNLFNASTLSFLTTDLGPEALADQNHSISSLDRNEVLPGRRSSIAMATNSNSYNSSTDTEQCCSRRNTDKDVQGFISRLSMTSDASLFSESDSEEEFGDYLALNDRQEFQDGRVGGDEDDDLGDERDMIVDVVNKMNTETSAASVALNACRLPKNLSLHAREA